MARVSEEEIDLRTRQANRARATFDEVNRARHGSRASSFGAGTPRNSGFHMRNPINTIQAKHLSNPERQRT